MGSSPAAQPATLRAGDLGIRIGATDTGPWNAFTDVPGVRVEHVTLIEGSGALRVRTGSVRTGVTVILPRDTDPWATPVFAGALALNGNGEITGLAWVSDSGMMMSPLALSSTHSVGIVRDALVAAEAQARPLQDLFWRLPVAETWDGLLNDINGGHITAAHVQQALDRATSGRVDEGNVGGGTGMICHGFKGGIGTSSRRVPVSAGGYAVGVLVQANHGRRDRLAINGVDVGQRTGRSTRTCRPAPACWTLRRWFHCGRRRHRRTAPPASVHGTRPASWHRTWTHRGNWRDLVRRHLHRLRHREPGPPSQRLRGCYPSRSPARDAGAGALRPPLRRCHRGHRGSDRERSSCGRDDDRPRLDHHARARRRPIGVCHANRQRQRPW